MKKVKLIFIALLFTTLLTGCFGKAPTLDGVDDVTVFVGETFDLMAGVNAKDGEDDITMFVETEVKDVDGNIVDFNTDNVFVFYVTYTVSGEGNRTTTKERIITITISSDTTPPVISGAVDIIIETENNYSPLQGVTVIDDYDGDMTDDIEYTITLGDGTIVTGLYWDTPDIITVVYTVTDNAGNEATTEITVTVVDVIDPVITAVDQTLDNDITIEVYNYATALDNIDGDMTDDITYTIEDELGTMITQIDGAAGIYTIVYTAVDMAGNEATKEITITVSDITGPVISTPSIFIYVPDHLTFNPLDYFTITDETDGDLTSAGVIRYNNAALEVVTVMDVPGFYTFNITVTDAAGNETYVNLALNVEGDPIIVEDLSGLYASTQLSQYYADIFDSGLTTAEVCAKYIGDIPFEMIITNEECLVGLAEVKTIVTNHNVDEVITYIIDDETYYTATVTLTLDNLEEITFEVDFNFKGYEYDSVIYLNFITDTFIFGPQSVEVTLTEAQAALQEYYTKLIDDTYDITTFCNTYVLGAVNNEFTLEECITAITSIRGYLLSFTIDSVSVEVITPPEGDSFNGYKDWLPHHKAGSINENGDEGKIFWNDGMAEAWINRWFTPNSCNFCDDVFAELADVTVMDAWLPEYSSDSKGTNLAIVRTPFINDLILKGSKEKQINIDKIPIKKVIESQQGVIDLKQKSLSYRLYLAKKNGLKAPIKRVEMSNKINLFKKQEIKINTRTPTHINDHNSAEICDLRSKRTLEKIEERTNIETKVIFKTVP